MVKGYMVCLVELVLTGPPLSARSFRTSGDSSKDANRKHSTGIGCTGRWVSGNLPKTRILTRYSYYMTALDRPGYLGLILEQQD